MPEQIGNYDVWDFNALRKEIAPWWRKPSVLLGNGYSLDLLNQVFSYGNLRQSIDVQSLNIGASIHNIFNNFGTDDFEEIIRRLEEADFIAHQYGVPANQLADDARTLKDELITAISNLHPDTPWDGIRDAEYDDGYKFLLHFRQIFTTNYDLILYWTILRKMVAERARRFTDGFSGKTELLWNFKNHNVFYLHGALHLFRKDEVDSYQVQKLKFLRGQEISLTDQIEDRIQNSQFPITVAEGNSQKKLDKINKNKYLRHCYQELQKCQGSLFTFGISFNNDQHILDAIIQSEISTLCAGIRNPTTAKLASIETIIHTLNLQRTRSQKPQLELYFYNATSAHVWR